jgi:hypothetical protein
MSISSFSHQPLKACCIFAFLVFLLSCAPITSARAALPQSSYSVKKDYALIYGTVWGPDDHPVSGVPVKIRRSSDKKARWELISDRNGEFAQRVPVGTQDYIVQADIKVPKGQAKPAVTAHIDNNERTDISLHLTSQELSHH